jgi:hypothetical protein
MNTHFNDYEIIYIEDNLTGNSAFPKREPLISIENFYLIKSLNFNFIRLFFFFFLFIPSPVFSVIKYKKTPVISEKVHILKKNKQNYKAKGRVVGSYKEDACCLYIVLFYSQKNNELLDLFECLKKSEGQNIEGLDERYLKIKLRPSIISSKSKNLEKQEFQKFLKNIKIIKD